MSEIKSAQCLEKALATVKDGNNLRRAFGELDNLDGETDGFYADDTSLSNSLALCKLAEEFGKERHTIQRIEQTTNTLYSFNNLINGIRRTKDRQTVSQMVLKKNSFAKFLEKSISWSDDYLNQASGSQDSIRVATSGSIGPEEWQNNAFAWVDNLQLRPAQKNEAVLADSKTLERQLQILQARADYAGLRNKESAGVEMIFFGIICSIAAIVIALKLKGDEDATIEDAQLPFLLGISGAGFTFGGMAIAPSDLETKIALERVRLLEGEPPTKTPPTP